MQWKLKIEIVIFFLFFKKKKSTCITADISLNKKGHEKLYADFVS